MKLTKLLENIKFNNIKQLKARYPFIETTLTDPYFITDLPFNITTEQLHQLCIISFPQKLSEHLLSKTNRHSSRIVIHTDDNDIDRKINMFQLSRKTWCKTWAEFVELIIKEYSFDSNDFED